ncbi:terminase small subunit, partial [Devosia sp. ZB163]|nr:terminase small subunit [Devosia sp. ZB163]
RVDEIIRAQKFEGAAAGLLNPNIIARDLGLADKQELTGKGGSPLMPTIVYEGRPQDADGK